MDKLGDLHIQDAMGVLIVGQFASIRYGSITSMGQGSSHEVCPDVYTQLGTVPLTSYHLPNGNTKNSVPKRLLPTLKLFLTSRNPALLEIIPSDIELPRNLSPMFVQ